MAEEKNIIVKYALILAVYTALAGGILALVFSITEPRRLDNAKKNELKAQQELIPQAVKFQEKNFQDLKYYEAIDQDDKVVGYIVLAKGKGYSSVLDIMVSLDKNLSISNLKVLAQAETPGLGTKITENNFLQQFTGKTLPLALKKDGGEIDAITGATITSRAFTNAVEKSLIQFKKSLQEEKKQI